MSQFKNNAKINLYYTDTDSIYTDSDIEDFLIDNKILGKLKLENVCTKAIFLAPKLYCLLTELYSIKITNNKRELIYNKNHKLISTKSYKIDSSKEINK